MTTARPARCPCSEGALLEDPTVREGHALAMVAAISRSACGGSGAHGQRERTREMTSKASTPDERGEKAAAPGTPIRIRVGDARLTARLDDNATAGDLAAQLPLTLTFRDHNSVEKTAPLPRGLSLEGVPAGHDPVAGDIG